MRLVGDFWKWNLTPSVSGKIDQLIANQLHDEMEHTGMFDITIDMLLVEFTKSTGAVGAAAGRDT